MSSYGARGSDMTYFWLFGAAGIEPMLICNMTLRNFIIDVKEFAIMRKTHYSVWIHTGASGFKFPNRDRA